MARKSHGQADLIAHDFSMHHRNWTDVVRFRFPVAFLGRLAPFTPDPSFPAGARDATDSFLPRTNTDWHG